MRARGATLHTRARIVIFSPMPLKILTDQYELKAFKLAGYYALDVDWGDGHGSIYPFRDLRPQCPCDACKRVDAAALEDPRTRTPVEISREKEGIRIVWEDDHTSLYPVMMLRDACRCALCAGEQGPVDMYLGKPK